MMGPPVDLLRSLQVCDDTSAVKEMGLYLPRSVYIQRFRQLRGSDIIITIVDGSHDLVSLIRETGTLDARAAGKEPDLDNFNIRKQFQNYVPVTSIEVIPLGYFNGLSVAYSSERGGSICSFESFLSRCGFSPRLRDQSSSQVRHNPFSSALPEDVVRYMEWGVELMYSVDFDPVVVSDPDAISKDIHSRISNRVAGEFKVTVVNPYSKPFHARPCLGRARSFI